MKSFGVGDEKSIFCDFLNIVVGKNNGQRAKTSRVSTRERVPPLQKEGQQKQAASPPTLHAGFSSFGKVERARA